MKKTMGKLLLMKLILLLLQHVNCHSTVEFLPGFNGTLPFHLQTGYIGVGKDDEVQLFYYFTKSESDPSNDPILLWLSGGPGCSSLIAFVYEIGPVRFAEKSLPTLVLNPHSWTKIASVIYLDQPVNTGFSYATTSDAYKYTDLQACEYVYEFLRKWLSYHPQFISNPFYVAGNSYSGITVPIVTQLISDGNERGIEPLVNLEGYLLGNPLTFPGESNYKIPFCHGMGLISNELYKSLKKNCRGEYRDIDPNNKGCVNAVQSFNQMVGGINEEHILRPNCGSDAELQIRHHDDQLSGERRLLHEGFPCSLDWRKLAKYWANDPRVQEALHVRKGVIGRWARCRKSIRIENYTITTWNVVPYHANLSNKGYRSLVYSGDHDLMVPFQSTQAWIKSLKHSIIDDWRPWTIDDQVAGYTRSYSNKMTYATVKGSGHTAGSYKPKECFVMFRRWIHHDPL